MDIIDAARNINKTHETDILAKLYTTWGETLDSDHVLEEYPRPQFKRENFTILNGLWDYAFTPCSHSSSTNAVCYDVQLPDLYDGKILVPFSPESLLSKVKRQLKPDEYLWYHRSIFISAKELSCEKRLILHFDAADQAAVVYINEEKAFSHHGGYLPFEGEITHLLREGENSIIVQIRDVSDTSYHSRGKQTLKRGGMFYTAQSGLWQSVWMEWVPSSYVSHIKITPDYDKRAVSFHLNIAYPCESTIPTISIYAETECIWQSLPDTMHSEKTDHSNKTILSVSADISPNNFYPWSPDSPFLYTVKISYGQDQIESYFAMRSFTIETDENGICRFCLNHNPYFLHGVLDQGYWPDGLYTAPSDDALIYDILMMKKLGFNMMRKHIKIECARWYYHCDRLGMLVWQDMVSGGSHYSMPLVCYLPTLFPGISGRLNDNNYKLFGRLSKEGREEWLKECAETVEYLYNVPSLAAWVPFNEGWGQFDANKVTAMIKNADPSRTVDQTSGWFDQKGGDFKSIHNYFRKLNIVKDKRAFVISEYGGFACHIDGHSSVERIYGYKKFENCDKLTIAYRKLIEKELLPLIEKGLSGAVYTQVSDVEEEVNGMLTYDRKICKINDINDI